MHYELWHVPSGNLVNTFEDEADALAVAEVRVAERRMQASREAEEEREGVLGEVDPDPALLAGEDDVAPH